MAGSPEVLTEDDCVDTAATVCKSPVLTEYTGLAGEYGCGNCPADSAATCVECTGNADAACNVEVEVKIFKCFSYTFNETTKAWEASDEAGECHAKKDTAVKCQK